MPSTAPPDFGPDVGDHRHDAGGPLPRLRGMGAARAAGREADGGRGARAGIRHHRRSRGATLRGAGVRSPGRGGAAGGAVRDPARRGEQEPGAVGAAVPLAGGPARRARRHRRRAGWRGRRRPRRRRRGHLPARDGARPRAHHASGDGGRRDRRQSGDRPAQRQEPCGRVPPAARRRERRRHAGLAASARTRCRLGRGDQARLHPRPRAAGGAGARWRRARLARGRAGRPGAGRAAGRAQCGDQRRGGLRR